ncbi:MAG: hypothetical protein ACM3PP_11450 [Candidatus Saccharibacteria bacterium]
MKKNAYLELLDKVILEECPAALSGQVLAQSGILAKLPNRLVAPETIMERRIFGFGSALVLALLLSVLIGGIYNSDRSIHERMARNSMAVADKASNIIQDVITEKERSDW